MRRAQEPLRGQEEKISLRGCDQPDCGEPGEFRAPKSPNRLDEFHWFCLDHVRQYNKAWNYYAGMSEEQVESETRRDTTWQRPTWPFGARSGGLRGFSSQFSAIFAGLFGEENPGAASAAAEAQRSAVHPASPEARSLSIMGLELPLTLTRLKSRYNELVKLHHPDANGGDKLAEERLKDINEANATLKKFLSA